MSDLIICLRLLTGKKIGTFDELKDAIKELHKMGPQTVAVSSTDIDEKLTSIVSTAKGTCIFLIWNTSYYLLNIEVGLQKDVTSNYTTEDERNFNCNLFKHINIMLIL